MDKDVNLSQEDRVPALLLILWQVGSGIKPIIAMWLFQWQSYAERRLSIHSLPGTSLVYADDQFAQIIELFKTTNNLLIYTP